MYRLQVMYQRRWKWGIRSYNTIEEALKRVGELAKVGIEARVKTEYELFN